MPLKRRRTSGDAGLFQDSRGYWNVQIELGYGSDGKRKRKRIRAKTQRVVLEKKAAFERERAAGGVVTPNKETFGAFLLEWLEDDVKRQRRATTYERGSEPIVRKHLIPHLGHIRTDKLTNRHCQQLLNTLHDQGLSIGTLKNIRAKLRAALKVAVKRRKIGANVAAEVELPVDDAPPKLPRYLTPDEARALLAAVAQDRLCALYWLALMLGLRKAEVTGLRWEDIDVEKGTIRISQTIQRQHGHLEAVPTKTKSVRTYPLIHPLPIVLDTHRARQEEEKTYHRWRETGYVFTTSIGTPIDPRDVLDHFKAALRAAGLPTIRFHDLRHSCATLLLSMGVNPKIVQDILGHKSFSITMDTYAHVMPTQLGDALVDLGELLTIPQKAAQE